MGRVENMWDSEACAIDHTRDGYTTIPARLPGRDLQTVYLESESSSKK